jgi:histidyl-tRNA synthetase
MASVNAVTEPPGGRYDGLIEEVEPSGTPATASVMGLVSAGPCIATENAKLAALPAATDCELAPLDAMLKSEADPTVIVPSADVLGRKFVSPE